MKKYISKIEALFTEKIIVVDPHAPDLLAFSTASRIIRTGGVVAYPTDTFYGLGADAFNSAAVSRVFSIKRRMLTKPLLVLVARKEDISSLVSDIPPVARILMDRFWPGPLTLIFRASSSLPASLTGGTGMIGIRVPGNPLTVAFLEAVGRPLTATSANLSGEPSLRTAQEVHEALGDRIDLILDGGPAPGGKESTIVDVTRDNLRIVRVGQVASDALTAAASGEHPAEAVPVPKEP